MNNLNVAKIQLNGDPYEIDNGINLNELLNKLKIKKKRYKQNIHIIEVKTNKNLN